MKSRVPVNEIFVQLQSGRGAFLRVELGRKNIITGDGATERRTVDSLSNGVLGPFRLGEIAVHEIEVTVVGNVLPHRVRRVLVDLVPAHLRYLEARTVFLDLAVQLEAYHFARQQAETGGIAFLADVEQHLLADAHAHQRLGPGGHQQRFLHAGLAQAAHAVRHGALAGQHDAVCGFDVGHFAGDQHIGFGCDGAQGLRDRAQITHAVINYYDFFHDVYFTNCPWSTGWCRRRAGPARTPCAARGRRP